MKWLARFHKNEQGATAVEYAVMLALILMAVFVAVQAVGSNLNSKYTNINAQISAHEN
jgi:pilus assembly protein Flp/PilA